jgi:hypothetical protein
MMMEEEHIVTHCVTALLITFIKAITSRSCIPMWTWKMHMHADDRSNSVRKECNSVRKEYLIPRARPMYRASCAHFHTHPVPRIAHVGSACFFAFACGFCWE